MTFKEAKKEGAEDLKASMIRELRASYTDYLWSKKEEDYHHYNVIRDFVQEVTKQCDEYFEQLEEKWEKEHKEFWGNN